MRPYLAYSKCQHCGNDHVTEAACQYCKTPSPHFERFTNAQNNRSNVTRMPSIRDRMAADTHKAPIVGHEIHSGESFVDLLETIRKEQG